MFALKHDFKSFQSALMRPQGMRPGLYVPTCPTHYANVCNILYSISN